MKNVPASSTVDIRPRQVFPTVDTQHLLQLTKIT